MQYAHSRVKGARMRCPGPRKSLRRYSRVYLSCKLPVSGTVDIVNFLHNTSSTHVHGTYYVTCTWFMTSFINIIHKRCTYRILHTKSNQYSPTSIICILEYDIMNMHQSHNHTSAHLLYKHFYAQRFAMQT